MRYNPFDENVVILGMAGSGKTTFAKYLLYQLLKRNIPYSVWDYNHQYPNSLGVIHYWDANTPIQLKRFNIIRPIDKSPSSLDKYLSIHLQTPNFVFVLEEAHEYVSKFSFYSPNLEKLIRTGRNFGNTYIAISQRPADLHNSFLSNAHHIISFKLMLPRDIEFLVKWVGEKGKYLKEIPKYHYLYKYYTEEPVIRTPIKVVI